MMSSETNSVPFTAGLDFELTSYWPCEFQSVVSPVSFFKGIQVPQCHLSRCPFCTGHAVQVHLPSYHLCQHLFSMLPVGTRTVKHNVKSTSETHLPKLTIWSFFFTLVTFLPVTHNNFSYYFTSETRLIWARIRRLNTWLASDHMNRLPSTKPT